MIVNLNTGKGYIEKDGKTIGKFDFPPGEHIFDDDLNVVQLADNQDLEVIEVEIVKSQVDEKERLIADKIYELKRQEAIAVLKQDGVLDANEAVISLQEKV